MITTPNEGQVNTTTHAGVTTIEFSHPKKNSLPSKLLETLAREIHFAGTHSDTRVIVIKSEGDSSFCAGASFDELIQLSDAEAGLHFFSGFAHVFNTMRRCPKFIIGRIQGTCTGGGVGLAAAMDYAVALNTADVKLSELDFGIGPFVVGPVIERKIGLAAFSALAIDAHMWRNSDWAKRKGLYAELHETVENMDESISRLAARLAHSNPEAIAEMKKMFWHGTEHWDDLLKERAEISGRLVTSNFTKEAIAKFKSTTG